MLLRSEGKHGELGRSGTCRQLSEEVLQERKEGKHGPVERWFCNRGAWARLDSGRGRALRGKREESMRQGLGESRRWDQRTGGGTTLRCCLAGEHDPYPDQPLLVSGPCLTGRTHWPFASAEWSTAGWCLLVLLWMTPAWEAISGVLVTPALQFLSFWLSFSIHHLKSDFQPKHVMPHGTCYVLWFFPTTDATY